MSLELSVAFQMQQWHLIGLLLLTIICGQGEELHPSIREDDKKGKSAAKAYAVCLELSTFFIKFSKDGGGDRFPGISFDG
jgi:hypothetical protein